MQQLTQLQDSNTLLTYSLMTTPSPVQVSPSKTSPSLAMLTYVVSCPRSIGTVKVAQIIIAVPVDAHDKPPDPTNLAATAPPLSSASISSTGTDEWTVAAGVAPGVFIFTPKGGGSVDVSLQSLTITLTGIQVNMLVGTALVKINEWASPAGSTPPPVNSPPSGSVSVAVPKFPYGFFAGNFGTDQPLIENGQHPTLSWVGSTHATYKMLWSKQTQDVSNIRTWSATSNPPSPALTDTTTFILEVSAQAGGQTVTEYFSLTVIVANPSFTAHDLTVLTTSTLEGAVTVGKAGAPKNLTLNGDLDAQGYVGVGTTDTQQAKLAVVTQLKNAGNNTALFYAPQIGPNTSNIHYGTTGDWYIRSASSQGKVIIQDTGASAFVGGPLSVGGNTVVGGSLTMNAATPQLILGGNSASAWVVDQSKGAFRIYTQAGAGTNTPQFVLEQNVLSVVAEIHNYVPGRNKWYRLLAGSQSGDWQWASWVALPSDIRLKEDVRPIAGALEKVNCLQGIFHRWNASGLDYLTQPRVDAVSTGPGSTEEELEALQRAERQKAAGKLSGTQLGLIAQDVEAIVPEVVYENEDGHKCIRYQQLVALLIEAIKEQEQTVKDHTKRLDQQQAVINRLKQV